MRVAVVGSRDLKIEDLGKYLPDTVTEIISGGARGVDACAKAYAVANQIKLMEILPKYDRYGRAAPLKRNLEVIDRAELVLAFWDGKSHGTEYVINCCKKRGKQIKVYIITEENAHTSR